MAGNHNSGRKPNPQSGEIRHKKITFYVKEYHDFHGWKLDPTFVWFKRHHGSKWQEKIRAWMYNDVKEWKLTRHWRCECDNRGVLGNYMHLRQPKCHKCGTWKNEAVRRIHE
jgi:hypothetical protein